MLLLSPSQLLWCYGVWLPRFAFLPWWETLSWEMKAEGEKALLWPFIRRRLFTWAQQLEGKSVSKVTESLWGLVGRDAACQQPMVGLHFRKEQL